MILAIDGVSDVDDAKILLCVAVSARIEFIMKLTNFLRRLIEFSLLFLMMRTVPTKPRSIRSEKITGMMIL